jgi:hypothetical protein
MVDSRASSVLVASCCLLVIACGADRHNGAGSRTEGQDAIIVMNGDDPEFFWRSSTQMALRALAEAPLAGARGELTGTPLLASDEGRRLLSYVVLCALPAGESLHEGEAGASLEGMVGLAPGWTSAPLQGVEAQRWVTACLLQTLNGLSMDVELRMTGSHPVLSGRGGAAASEFTTPDTTMFGNVFDPDGPAAFACIDNVDVTVCGVDWSAHSLQRICGLSPTCGATLLGPCSLSCAHAEDGHATCDTPEGDRYAEAISTRLHSGLSLDLLAPCSP